MINESDPDLAALGRLSRLLSDLLASIDDDQRILATPCVDWDLSGLVDHVTGGNWFTTRILAGQLSEDAMEETIELFDGRSVSNELAVGSVDDQLSAFQRPGVLDQTCHHVAGDLTGRQILRIRLHDLIVHSWDVSQTLSPPAVLPIDLVRWATAELADSESLAATLFNLAEIPPFDTGDPAGTYLRCFGRSLQS